MAAVAAAGAAPQPLARPQTGLPAAAGTALLGTAPAPARFAAEPRRAPQLSAPVLQLPTPVAQWQSSPAQAALPLGAQQGQPPLGQPQQWQLPPRRAQRQLSPEPARPQWASTAAFAAPAEGAADAEEDAAGQPAGDEPEEQCTYNAERVIGNGTFGIVYSAHVVEKNETVAIKKVFVDRRYRNRELQVWEKMRHPNIVTLKHAFYTSGESHDELYLNMVMEYVPETVYCVMKRHGKQNQPMPSILLQLYTYQACRALAHLRACGVVHRDIKPQNLLVNASRGHILKLCDFGSAAKLGQGRPALVAYICSRYYRAPELIFGATQYTTTVDLWSIGCVLAEMIRGRPLFPGENGVDQLVEIVKVLGSPSRRQILAMNPAYFNFTFPAIRPCSWRTVFRQDVGFNFIDLLAAFLQYDPEARIHPLQACAHPCFDELRQEHARVEGARLPPDLFNLTQREAKSCPAALRERLIPAWHTPAEPAGGHGP